MLLVDPGVTNDELACLMHDLQRLRMPVVAGFATHPHWDHLLWRAEFGTAPRYATCRCAAAVSAWLSAPGAAARVAESGLIPSEFSHRVPLDLLGQVDGLATDTIPWHGPEVRIIEHQAHAPGHGALLIRERRVLVSGDVLSDVLIPLLDLNADDPLGDYLDALAHFERAMQNVDVLIPGHGSAGRGTEVPERIAQDRAYIAALSRDGNIDDPRLSPSAYGKDWLPAIHQRQVQHLARRAERQTPETEPPTTDRLESQWAN